MDQDKLRAARIVEHATKALSCSFGAFYLIDRPGFKLALSVGSAKPSADFKILQLLHAAWRGAEESIFHNDLSTTAAFKDYRATSTAGEPFSIRFASIAKIMLDQSRLCGFLLVADSFPRTEISASLVATLRHHTDNLAALLELCLLRHLHGTSNSDSEADVMVLGAHNRTGPTSRSLSLEAEIEEQKRIAAQLLFRATHDELTMLYNRQFFMDRLVSCFEKFEGNARFKFAVLVIDMDGFKSVNDTWGHRAGDHLLVEVARRLRASTRPGDTLARLGGDEFGLLVEGLENVAVAEAVAQRIIDTIGGRPVMLGRREVRASCSIGVVEAAPHDRLPEELLSNADTAMYNAKRRKLGYSIFEQKMRNEMARGAQLQVELEKAVLRQEFFLHYQPIWQISSTQIVGFEALVRWQHPRHGVMLPEMFIASAESTGLIREIGLWVLHTACAQLGSWRQQYPHIDVSMSVNVSGEQLKSVAFISEVSEVLRTTAIPPQSLQLEVTESVFIAASKSSDEVISGLKALGIKLSLDDFGTGYSSLSYVDRYPIDVIKIDRSFVSNIATRPRTLAVVQAITQLGRALNIDVLAEGIEADEQYQALTSAGCRFAQGNLLTPASSPAQLLPRLSHNLSLKR